MAFFKAPALNKLQGGYADPKARRTDAIGRAGFRSDQAKENSSVYTPGQSGGMPEMRNERSFIPYLLEAAKQYKIPAQQVTRQSVLNRVRKLGIVPQQIAKSLGTSDPVEQAYMIVKNQTGGLSGRPNSTPVGQDAPRPNTY